MLVISIRGVQPWKGRVDGIWKSINVVPPLNGVAWPSTLGRERETEQSQMK